MPNRSHPMIGGESYPPTQIAEGSVPSGPGSTIPIDWSQITTGLPTTLAGYGITDAYTKTASDARYLSIGGGTLTGALIVSSGGIEAAAGNIVAAAGTIAAFSPTPGSILFEGLNASFVTVFLVNDSGVIVNGSIAVAQVTGAAPLASPALTGTPTAPTATVGTNTTQLATTAFVLANAAASIDTVTPLNDADVTIAAGPTADVTVPVIAITTKRTINLPSTVSIGRKVRAVDASGAVSGTNLIDMNPGASDTINGSNTRFSVLATAWGEITAYRVAAGAWSIVGAISDPISSVPADLTTLWTNLGVSPTAWFSTRLLTTVSGGKLTSWEDVRGPGFGGVLTAPGVGPAFSGTTITLAGLAADYMALAASSLYDLSGGGTLVVVCAPTTGGALDRIHVGISESSLTRIHAVGAGASGSQGNIGGAARGSSTLAYPQSIVTTSTTKRLVVFSKNATTALALDVPNKTRVTGTTDAAGAGNLGLAIGDYFKSTSIGQGAFGTGTLFEIGWFKGVQFSPTQVTACNTWATATPINAVDA